MLRFRTPDLFRSFFYFLINLTGSSISSGNSDAGLPVATSVIQVAYMMHEGFSILGVDRIFWRVGMKPGAAVLAGRYGKTLILALSGNQYASYVDLHMIVRPVLSEFTGNNRLEMIRGAATLMDDYDKKSPFRRFIRAIAQDEKVYIDGHTGGNGDVSSGRNINAMVDVPAGSDKLPAGSEVQVILI